MDIDVRVNPEYFALLPPLSKEEYEALKDSIKKHGLYHPIIVNQDKVVLDGHHRLKACRELGITPRFEVWRCFEDDKLAEKEFVIEVNLRRRQLNAFQRAELGYVLYLIEKEKAKQRQLSKLKQFQNNLPLSSFELNDKGQARDIAAAKVNLKPTTFQRALVIIERGSKDLLEKCRTGEISIAGAYKRIIMEEKRRKFWKTTTWDLPDNVQLINCDFRDAKIEDASIDAIITDPPYGNKFLYLFEELGKFAKRVLKPTGLLILYTGNTKLPEKLHILNQYLNYFWMEIKIMGDIGGLVYIGNEKIFHRYKPVSVFYKEDLVLPESFASHSDVYYSSKRPDQAIHPWEQEVDYWIYLIKKYVNPNPNSVICDPMCGSGSLLIASLKTGHPCIGIDIDPEAIKITEQRLRRIKQQ